MNSIRNTLLGKSRGIRAGLALLALLGLSACGKQTFDKQQFSGAASANNQSVTIKPKVDIIMFQDISGSMVQPEAALKAQLSSFLSSINANWDFHFAVLPLQRQDDLRGRYVIAQDCSGVMNCLTPAQSFAFDNGSGWYSADANFGSVDHGFINMQANLSNSASMTGSGFLRPDAMLVVIPFTNGNDTSGMSFPTDYRDRGDGQQVPNYNSANAVNSYNSFRSFLTSTLKPSISLVSFYSVVAGNQNDNPDYSYSCAGATAWSGTRYIQMAMDIENAYPGFSNGGNYNICTNQLQSVLSSISSRMQNLVLAVEFNFIALPERPVPGSLKVYKNGNLLPANTSNNGWTLFNVVGGTQQYTSNKATSYAPTTGNNRSGFFVELHGSSRFKGSDQITYTYEKF